MLRGSSCGAAAFGGGARPSTSQPACSSALAWRGRAWKSTSTMAVVKGLRGRRGSTKVSCSKLFPYRQNNHFFPLGAASTIMLKKGRTALPGRFACCAAAPRRRRAGAGSPMGCISQDIQSAVRQRLDGRQGRLLPHQQATEYGQPLMFRRLRGREEGGRERGAAFDKRSRCQVFLSCENVGES